MLYRVEEASGGITVCPLPAGDCRAGILVELPCCLCMEATTVQSPLHVATLPLVEADLVFRFLSCFVCKGRRIDGRGHVAGRDDQTGFGSIRTDENPQDRQCKDQDAHGLLFRSYNLTMIFRKPMSIQYTAATLTLPAASQSLGQLRFRC